MIMRPIVLSASVLLVASLSFMSCASLQRDVKVSAAGEPLMAALSDVSLRIVALDALSAHGARDTRDMREVRESVTSLERSAVRDAAFEASLAAWSGRLFLLEGRRADAEARLKRAAQMDVADIAVIVLKSRLETDSAKRLALLDAEIAVSDDSGALDVEKALAMLGLGRYREAVALFDEAFPKLPRVYAETYRTLRDNAWNMRNAGDGASATAAAILSRSAVTWRDTLDLTLEETDLLAGYVDGANAASREALFERLLDRGIAPSRKFTDGKYADGGDARSARRIAERMGEPIMRADAAWFLWHLYAGLRGDPTLLSRYSRSLAERHATASPVPDVPSSSPFFDSALGCVEWEFMSLVDGVSFKPEKTVDGASLLRMLQRLEK